MVKNVCSVVALFVSAITGLLAFGLDFVILSLQQLISTLSCW